MIEALGLLVLFGLFVFLQWFHDRVRTQQFSRVTDDTEVQLGGWREKQRKSKFRVVSGGRR